MPGEDALAAFYRQRSESLSKPNAVNPQAAKQKYEADLLAQVQRGQMSLKEYEKAKTAGAKPPESSVDYGPLSFLGAIDRALGNKKETSSEMQNAGKGELGFLAKILEMFNPDGAPKK